MKRIKNEQVYLPQRKRKINKFTEDEKTEKWTSLLILKSQKDEQVYWSWKDTKNKFIAGKETTRCYDCGNKEIK